MSPAAKTVHYFSIYLMILGATLIGVPNLLLTTFKMAETQEVWIRVVGVLVICISIYYMLMARENHSRFLMMTVYVRLTVLGWFILFVVLQWAPATLILFGLVDAAAAAWTYFALKKEASHSA
ncbi:MAG: hypothetical protein JST46_03610 [Bacteroidetes bacterium]|nr:hypothetical protein [Bacteroidota bacterium]